MYMKAKVSECDYTGKTYPELVEGAYVLAQGATGRWCPVMFVGPEWLTKHKPEILTEEQVEKELITLGGWLEV